MKTHLFLLALALGGAGCTSAMKSPVPGIPDAQSTLYGIERVPGNSWLVTVDMSTGKSTRKGIDPVGFSDIRSLAYDSLQHRLYAVDVDRDQLIEIDPGTGVGTAVFASPELDGATGLTYFYIGNELFSVNRVTDRVACLYRDPLNNGAWTVADIGPTPGPVPQAITFSIAARPPGTGFFAYIYDTNPVNGTPYLYLFDLESGDTTPIGPLDLRNIQGTASDLAGGTLYAVMRPAADSHQLLTVNSTTGKADPVVPPTIYPGDITALAIALPDDDLENTRLLKYQGRDKRSEGRPGLTRTRMPNS